MTWRAESACQYTDPEAFFPQAHGHGRGAQRALRAATETAKRICGGCPVRAQCLDEAMRRGPRTYGVWGGTTRDERLALREREAVPA